MSEQVIPEVDMGVTCGVGSDRYPYTVSEIVNDKTIKVRPDSYRRTDSNGLSEMQTYEITPNPDAPEIVLTLRINGRWVRKGETMRGSSYRWSLGHRDAYSDPSF